MDKLFVCETEELENGEIKHVEREEEPGLAIYKMEGKFYASDDQCTHAQALLSQGEIFEEEGEIECPLHGGAFDLRTGEATAFPCVKPLAVYPVTVEDGKVYVDLNKTATSQT